MILIVDKPEGLTSQAVVAQIKRAAGDRKLKIGHTGTLDPMCTGVLPVLTGRDTKLASLFPSDKRYTAGIRFGLETDTQDVTGTVLSRSDVAVDAAALRAVLPEFTGAVKQVPPMYSAIRVGGKRLYELARAGVEVPRAARTVRIDQIDVLEQTGQNEFLLDVRCSKGTYIRTLCADLGRRLGSCAAMSWLRRTASNGFVEKDATPLSELLEAARAGTLRDFSVRAEDAFAGLVRVDLPENGVKYFLNGGTIDFRRIGFVPPPDALLRAYAFDRFVALGRRTADGVRCVWNAQEDDALPQKG